MHTWPEGGLLVLGHLPRVGLFTEKVEEAQGLFLELGNASQGLHKYSIIVVIVIVISPEWSHMMQQCQAPTGHDDVGLIEAPVPRVLF